MGLKKFVILLDQPVYYSGQTISGKLVVDVDKPMSMRAIYLRYSGTANVHWTESHRRNNESHTVTYSNYEDYLGLQQLVVGNDAEDFELAEGEHVFLFNCQLPINIPNSFEGVYGRVRYSVKATINRPWKFNHVISQPMTVMSVLDLNRNAFAVAPVLQQTTKTFWGHSKGLFMSVNLPIRGFVPGQIMPIKVSLNNESKIQVKSVSVSLKQNVMFHASGKSRATKINVFKNVFPVPEGFGCEEVPLNLQLPAVSPSYLEFCRIIDLNYQLTVTARVDAWYHKNLKTHVEVIVGNIPVMSYQIPISVYPPLSGPVDQATSSYSQAPDTELSAFRPVLPPETMHGDLLPPTYEQSMGQGSSGKENSVNDRHDDDEVIDFVPLYPVYKFECCS